MDIEIILKNIIRTGVVSSVNEETCTARVIFDDRDNMQSDELRPLNRGSAKNKDYWLPDVGEQVVCLFLPNSKNLNVGWILGTYFSEQDAPQIGGSTDKRIIDFGDGTHISYDRAKHELQVNCVGDIHFNAQNIYNQMG